MALHVLKSPASLPDLSLRSSCCAVAATEKRNGFRKLFGSRTGRVSVYQSQGSSVTRIRVIPPVWRKGKAAEHEHLRRCYEQVLHAAAEHNCQVLSLPLLTEKDPQFPAYIDFKVAVDTAKAFLQNHEMEIFLQIGRGDAFRMTWVQRELENILLRHFPEESLHRNSRPFAEPEDCFDTVAPLPPVSRSAGCDTRKYAPAPKSARRLPIPMPDFSASRPSREDLSRLLQTVDAGFSETLLKLIDKSGKKDSEIYNKANVSRQHFSKIRNNPDYKPTKATAVAFAIALELNIDQTRDLIGRAGYALTNSSKFDVIIMYFIRNGNYNMFDINETLYAFDQNLLGV